MYTLLKSLVLSLLAERSTPHDELAKRDNVTLAAPIVAVPSQHWDGIDGNWSTFEIRVGTLNYPNIATFRVLPITSWQETWVIYSAAAGVCNTTLGVPADCGDSRGGLFNSANSSSWNSSDQYALGLDQAMGYDGVGQYGFDTVGLGYTASDGPTLSHQIVAEIVSDTWWLGQLGIGFQPTNFTGFGDPQASFADTLYSNGTISSMSWSYTAGAVYRNKGVFGDLIFGGYDKSRFTPNDVRFTMANDNLRDTVVTLRSITSTTASGNTTLMSTPALVFIDSSVPELWLPVDVCQAFEKAFGLTMDPTTELYLVDDNTHSRLQALNPSITLSLSDQTTATGPTVDITLPYSAFDLPIGPPALNGTGRYFPLRQQNDNTMYALGRTFLQEAYVTTHYNSRTFNVSQCAFPNPLSPQIIALPATLPSASAAPSPSSTSDPKAGTTHSSKKLSGGAIAGITIAIIALLAFLALLIAICLRRRRRSTKIAEPEEPEKPKGPVHEIDAGRRTGPAETSAYAAQASKMTNEVEGRETLEKDGNPIMQPQELEAEVPAGIAASGLEPDVANGPGSRQSPGVSSEGSPPQRYGQHEPSPVEDVSSEGNGTSRSWGDHIVSPNTEAGTMGPLSATERARLGLGNESSPTGSSGGWSMGKRGSRFEENM